MTDNELLLAISDMMDIKLESKLRPIRTDITEIKQDLQTVKLDIENNVKRQLDILAENYLPAAKRYEKATNELIELKADVKLLKDVVREHSEKLQRIS